MNKNSISHHTRKIQFIKTLLIFYSWELLSKYQLHLPTEKELEIELKREINEIKKQLSKSDEVVNNGWTDKARELFDMANDLEMQISDRMNTLEFVEEVINKLTELYPESLDY